MSETASEGDVLLEVVLVSYNSRDLVRQLLDRLTAGVPVVVVDNASGRDGVDRLVAEREGLRFLDGGGVGFARAANRGARASTATYVAFANPDSEPGPHVFEDLVAVLEKDPLALSASALLVGHSGRAELGGAGWEPRFHRAFVHALGLHKLFPRAGLWARPDVGQQIDVDWTTGAALVVRREAFLRLGGFDERFYVYSEDVALGAAARRAGMRQLLRTDITVPHDNGTSGAPSTQMMRLRGASMAQYLSHHRAPVEAVASRGVLGLGYAVRMAGAALRGDRVLAARHLAWVQGVLTGRAVVGGVEVSRSRARAAGACLAPR